MLHLVPLRVKERINHTAGRAVFDLSYYLQFQPSTLVHTGVKVALQQQRTEPGTRRRVALVTPHLGPGGAERVLLDIAESFDRQGEELFVIATHSRDSRWLDPWRRRVDHVHDLSAEYGPENIASALYSLVVNHAMSVVVLQNTLYGYIALPQLRTAMPMLQIVDVVHAVGGPWDLVRVVAPVAGAIDTRLVISEGGRRHLAETGTPEERIRLIPNGVDLNHFRPAPGPDDGIFRILFAARLDPVKRPLLLPWIAAELRRIQPKRRFRMIVAGDGPQSEELRADVEKAGVSDLFEFRGFMADVAPLMIECDALLLTSSHEGIPLSILEAFASGRPAVAPRAGAIAEILDPEAGVLVIDTNRPAAFAQALSMLMDDTSLRKEMGTAARRVAEQQYDRRRSIESYRKLWMNGTAANRTGR